jgi:hypothetical protein
MAFVSIISMTFTCGKATAAEPATQPATQPAENYRVVNKADGLSCSFSQDISTSGGYGLGGGTMYATANHFKCVDKDGKEREIELISTNVNESAGIEKNGKLAIRTKDFGTVYRRDDVGKLDEYEMTDSQIKKLKTFLGLDGRAGSGLDIEKTSGAGPTTLPSGDNRP